MALTPEWQALIDQATANENAEDAAGVAFKALADRLKGLISQLEGSPTKDQLIQFAADLKTHADALSAGIVANTPA